MAARQLDVMMVSDPENLFYLTGHQTTGYSYFQALVVPIDQEPFMVTRQLEESNVVHRTWVEVTRPYSDTGDAMQQLFAALQEFGLVEGKTVGYERNSYFLPAYQQDRIKYLFDRERLVGIPGVDSDEHQVEVGVERTVGAEPADREIWTVPHGAVYSCRAPENEASWCRQCT